MLAFNAISKTFNSIPAARDVTIAVAPGRVHGILGENGAGKSTLMNVAVGILRPSSGTVSVDGRTLRPGSPRAALAAGLGMVHQHFRLSPRLTVLENMVLATQRGWGVWSRRKALVAFNEACGRLHWDMNADVRVDDLSVGQRQRVEIIKALLSGGRYLILDEPTAVLTPAEALSLMDGMRALAREGSAVVFISHKLNEVVGICDDISILRRGELVFTGPMGDMKPGEMAAKMLGREIESPAVGASRSAGGGHQSQPLLRLDRVCVSAKGAAHPLLTDVSLSVHTGEIVGVAGVQGNGQEPLAAAIIGRVKPTSGDVFINGRPQRNVAIRERRKHIGFIPADRHEEALVMGMSVADNLLLKEYNRSPLARAGWRSGRATRQRAGALARQFDVRCRDLADPVSALSGGNQQKVVLARELSCAPEILLAVNPTRGLDVGAAAFVLRQLMAARDRGVAIVLIHSDLDELLSISDRVCVLYAGRLTPMAALDRKMIGEAMLGLVAAAWVLDGPAGGDPASTPLEGDRDVR